MTVVGLIAAGPLVRSLFGHGQLAEPALLATTTTFALLLTGLLASSLNLLLARAFYAQGNTSLPVLTTLAQVTLAVAVALVSVPALGLAGIALGVVLGSWLRTLAMLFLLALRFRTDLLRELARAVLPMLPAVVTAALVAAAGLALTDRLALEGLPHNVLALLAAAGPGTLTYLLVSWLGRLPELERSRHWAGSLLKRDATARTRTT